MLHRRLLTGLGVMFVSSLAFASDPPAAVAPAGDAASASSTEAVEILKKVDAAAKAVKAAKYEVKFEGVGESAAKVPTIEGTWLTAEIGERGPKKYRIDAKVSAPGKDPQKLTVGSDGETYYLLDHDKKKAYVDIDPSVIGRTGSAIAGQATMGELGHPKPFSDEIDGKVKELKGSKVINGEDCYEIFVTYNQPQDAIWWFSKKDFLPRARQDIFKREDGVRTTLKTLAKFELDPKVAADAFKLVVPEGYETTDDFAP